MNEYRGLFQKKPGRTNGPSLGPTMSLQWSYSWVTGGPTGTGRPGSVRPSHRWCLETGFQPYGFSTSIRMYTGWWWLEHDFYVSIQLGMSSSQLTNSFFRGVAQPPTSIVCIVKILRVCRRITTNLSSHIYCSAVFLFPGVWMYPNPHRIWVTTGAHVSCTA